MWRYVGAEKQSPCLHLYAVEKNCCYIIDTEHFVGSVPSACHSGCDAVAGTTCFAGGFAVAAACAAGASSVQYHSFDELAPCRLEGA